MTKTNAQKEAKENGLTHYISQRPCKRCGGYQRYAVSGCCSNLECRRKYETEWTKNNPEKRRLYNKKRRLKAKFDMTCEEYDKIYEQQNKGCAICGAEKSEMGRILAVDHDHFTGKIRGLLCNKCNQGLGFFNDSVDLLESAVIYLNSNM
jgi:hypothetical protein